MTSTPSPSLTISVFADPVSLRVGEWITFYLVYRNNGSVAAPGVVLDSTIAGGCFDVVGKTIALGSLAPGASGSRSFDAQARSVGDCTNTATITSNSQPLDTDAVTVSVAP